LKERSRLRLRQERLREERLRLRLERLRETSPT
jgi:hypothetical protein